MSEPNYIQGHDLRLGKIPPQDIEVEAAVLGACLLSSDAVDIVMGMLPRDEGVFYLQFHEEIYQCMVALFTENKPIDLLTVTAKARNNTSIVTGGAYEITQLTLSVAGTGNVETHCLMVLQHYFARIIIKANSKSIDALYSGGDPFETMDREYAKLEYIMGILSKRDSKTLPVIIDENLTKAEHSMTLDDHITGITTGFTEFNAVTAGFQNSDLIILAARPGMGKTALSLSMAKAMAEAGHPVAFFSLEMSEHQLVGRIQAAEADMSLEAINAGRIQQYEFNALKAKSEKLKSLPIYIQDTPAMNILEVRAKSSMLKKKHGIECIFVDYLQLMSGDKSHKNREQEISSISRGLKALAKELDIPVIALSQLSRAVESRGGEKKPQLSDLRESGSIEQDADMVAFLYRPEYYKIYEDENGAPTQGMAQIIIAKHRNGRLLDFWIKFVEKFVKFTDLGYRDPELSPENVKLAEQYSGKSVDKEANDEADDIKWID